MRQPRVRTVMAAALLSGAWALTAAGPATAHEDRNAKGLSLAVGWGDEPAYTGFKNSVQLTVSRHAGAPVTDLKGDVQVEVIYGDASVTLPIEPNFGAGGSGVPGDYRAWLTPTRPGTYTFHITGSIAGRRVDERFSSGPDTFDSVQDVSAIQFPAKDPSTGALAERTEREMARLRRELASDRRSDEGDGTPAVAWIALGASLVALAGLVVIGGRGARRAS